MSDHPESSEHKVPRHIVVRVDPNAGPFSYNCTYPNNRSMVEQHAFECNNGMCRGCYQERLPFFGYNQPPLSPKPFEWESRVPLSFTVNLLYETNRMTLLAKMLILYPKTDRIRKRHIGKKILKVRTHKFNESDNLPKYDDSFLNEVHIIIAVKTRKFKIGDMRDDHCNECGKEESELSCCAKCKVTQYCDSLCQKKNWKLHKIDCEDDMVVSMNTQLVYPLDKQVTDIYDINYCSNEWVVLDK